MACKISCQKTKDGRRRVREVLTRTSTSKKQSIIIESAPFIEAALEQRKIKMVSKQE